jgi:hypothetical protein
MGILPRHSSYTPASNRNEYQDSSWDKGLPELKAGNLTAICEQNF